MSGRWCTRRAGSAGVYLLSILSAVLVIVSFLSGEVILRAETMKNLKMASAYLSAEHEVIRCIRCHLANDQLIDESIFSGGVSFSLSWNGAICTAVIDDPVREVLQVEYDAEEGSVYDYSCLR